MGFKQPTEIGDLNNWMSVSGTAAAELKPGRYWVYLSAYVNAGVTGCTAAQCKNYANIKANGRARDPTVVVIPQPD